MTFDFAEILHSSNDLLTGITAFGKTQGVDQLQIHHLRDKGITGCRDNTRYTLLDIAKTPQTCGSLWNLPMCLPVVQLLRFCGNQQASLTKHALEFDRLPVNDMDSRIVCGRKRLVSEDEIRGEPPTPVTC